jgi:hypothetical protein
VFYNTRQDFEKTILGQARQIQHHRIITNGEAVRGLPRCLSIWEEMPERMLELNPEIKLRWKPYLFWEGGLDVTAGVHRYHPATLRG